MHGGAECVCVCVCVNVGLDLAGLWLLRVSSLNVANDVTSKVVYMRAACVLLVLVFVARSRPACFVTACRSGTRCVRPHERRGGGEWGGGRRVQ